MKLSTWYLIAAVLLIACTKEKSDPPEENGGNNVIACEDLSFDFQDDIQPIFSTNCALPACHNNQSAQSGVILATYEQIKDEVLNGKVIPAIKYELGGSRNMPQGREKLSDVTIRKIECWAEAGAPEN